MSVKAIDLKNWCVDNISPLAWSRIVLKVLPELRELGHTLDSIENPRADLELNDKVLNTIESAMQAIYELDLPKEVVN